MGWAARRPSTSTTQQSCKCRALSKNTAAANVRCSLRSLFGADHHSVQGRRGAGLAPQGVCLQGAPGLLGPKECPFFPSFFSPPSPCQSLHWLGSLPPQRALPAHNRKAAGEAAAAWPGRLSGAGPLPPAYRAARPGCARPRAERLQLMGLGKSSLWREEPPSSSAWRPCLLAVFCPAHPSFHLSCFCMERPPPPPVPDAALLIISFFFLSFAWSARPPLLCHVLLHPPPLRLPRSAPLSGRASTARGAPWRGPPWTSPPFVRPSPWAPAPSPSPSGGRSSYQPVEACAGSCLLHSRVRTCGQRIHSTAWDSKAEEPPWSQLGRCWPLAGACVLGRA